MDINTTLNSAAAAAAAAVVKTPEAETETPPRIYPAKPLSYSSNGVLRRLNGHLRHHNAAVVHYKECLKNHAAALGRHSLDGCGEFSPSPAANPSDPTSLKCAACGCHRNFHRREPPEKPLLPPPEYQSFHRHRPLPPRSPSPPPISAVFLSLRQLNDNNAPAPVSNPIGKKRFRTKFTQNQKERMLEFAERIGWKIQRSDEELIKEFCNEIGVERGALKIWMHNNKNKKDHQGINLELISTKSC